jgi:Asp-tRNA(Asn)/Glu-tRNA(Gln) amidotransferase A subunit family amidase
LPIASPINVLGLPDAVVPVTLHNGRPIGVQLIAGRCARTLRSMQLQQLRSEPER